MKAWHIILPMTVILVCIACFFMGRCSVATPDPEIRVEVRTEYDTIRIPEPVEKIRYVTRVDSISYPVSVNDTITQIIYVPVPIEETEYRDSTYFAIVEGYKARLKYIEVYNKNVFTDRVERYKVKPHWGLGVQIGYGYNFNKFYPYVGVGVQYSIITW